MKKIYLIIMMGMILFMISCGKKDNENKQNVSNIGNSDVDDQEVLNEDPDYMQADEGAVIDALDVFLTGLRMEDLHTHEDKTRCNIEFIYEPNYTSVEFTYYNPLDKDSKSPFLRLEMQGDRVRVLVQGLREEQRDLLEAEGMIDGVKPEHLKRLAETLMNFESIENVGIDNINDNMYWVENVKYKDNEIVQFLVCQDRNGHSMVKYGDSYLPVVSHKSDREVVLDGSYESTLDEINSTIKDYIPEDVLNEWIQWINN